MATMVAVPVKRFYVAKRRLAPVLGPADRSRLGRQLAARTLSIVVASGARPLVLAGDEVVAEWARRQGAEATVDTDDLDRAAATATEIATARAVPWIVLHADLPLLAPSDVTTALESVEADEAVLAPSADGGTSLIGGSGPFSFSFGAGSFHRHLARLPSPRILVRVGLSLDLDDPDDLAAAAAHPRGGWLRQRAALRR